MATTSTAAQRRRARLATKAHFSSRERQRRLSVAKLTATDEELIAQAIREGRVRRLSPKEPEPEPEPTARSWKKRAPAQGSVSQLSNERPDGAEVRNVPVGNGACRRRPDELLRRMCSSCPALDP